MSSNIFVTFGSLVGTEQLQTRTKLASNINQNQTRTRSCSSTTRFTNTYYRGIISTSSQQTRRQRTCTSQQVTVKKLFEAQINTTCNWVNTFQNAASACTGACLTNGCTQGATRCFLLNASTCQFQTGQSNSTCTFVQVGQDIDPFCEAEGFACIAGGTQTTCENSTEIFFGSWSSFSDYNGSDCSGISTCNSGTVGGVQYECSSRPINVCSWQSFATTDDSTCLANNISCENATTNNPDIDCSSYELCTCTNFTDWSNVTTCSQVPGTGICSDRFTTECRTVQICEFGQWTEWEDTNVCESSTPNCTAGALQRECRIV
jgi:hypothetical protein